MREIYAAVAEPGRALNDEQLAASLQRTLAARPAGAGWWIFAYGSLLWNPLFPVAEMRVATLRGWHRRFRLWSLASRGTPEAPGLVLALDADPQGLCHGVAYRLAPETAEETLAYLRARELVTNAYDEHRLPLDLDDGRTVEAYAYVMNRAHPQYRGGLTLAEQAEVIARAAGPMGPNAEYLLNTVASLEALGLEDAELAELAELVRGAGSA